MFSFLSSLCPPSLVTDDVSPNGRQFTFLSFIFCVYAPSILTLSEITACVGRLCGTGSRHTRFHWTNTAYGRSCGPHFSLLTVCPWLCARAAFPWPLTSRSFIHSFHFYKLGESKKWKRVSEMICLRFWIWACACVHSSPSVSHTLVSPCLLLYAS